MKVPPAPQREPTAMEASAPLRIPELGALRQAAARRRARAFCDAPESVFGIVVEPVTPRTFSLLFASGSHFIHGGQATEDDVLSFIWLHSPLFVFPEHPQHRARKKAALRRLRFELDQPWRRWLGLRPSPERWAAVMALVVADIHGLVEDAFADAPKASGRPGAPVATLEAMLVHQFSSAYPWSEEKIRRTPLRKLFQLDRCLAVERGHEIRDTAEDALLYDHLRRRNDALAAARGDTAPKAEASAP